MGWSIEVQEGPEESGMVVLVDGDNSVQAILGARSTVEETQALATQILYDIMHDDPGNGVRPEDIVEGGPPTPDPDLD